VTDLTSEQIGAQADRSGRRTILIVDDEITICHLLARMSEHDGHKAVVTDDPREGLAIVKKGGIDLLITDLRMPKLGGLELIREIRTFNGALEIIVITGYGTMEIFIDAIRAGASDFILKPIDREQYRHAVHRSLERVQLAESLADRTRQLVQSEKMASLGLLSTGIAHEINNPTTFIRSNMQLLQEYIKRLRPRMDHLDDEKNRESLKQIVLTEFPQMIEEALKGTDRIQRIVAGIKHYAHMGDESFDENVDIREVIAQSVTLVRSRLRKNITISENYLNLREIRGHFSKLEQVFVNLLINAADAINDKINDRRKAGDRDSTGLIDVSATVIEGDEEEGGRSPDFLILTFYDNGKGIPDEKLNRIFDPFFTTKPVGVGTGLGLYICYEIIKQHGGEITVQSEVGEGTAFIIKLPVEGAAADVAGTRDPTAD
jgi:signal transduction histidine kinase